MPSLAQASTSAKLLTAVRPTVVGTTRAVRASIATDAGIRRISDQQRPGRRSSAQPRQQIGEPLRRPSRKPDADAVWRMTGQIASHQPPDESGRAEHHHVQLTVSAHQLILKTRARRSRP